MDDVVQSFFHTDSKHIIIKLDVEGEEINALKGAKNLLEKDVLLYYEDHGMDRECKVTRYVLEELGMCVFFCQSDGSFIQITRAEEAEKVKAKRSVGYNFFSCHSDSVFLEVLQEVG